MLRDILLPIVTTLIILLQSTTAQRNFTSETPTNDTPPALQHSLPSVEAEKTAINADEWSSITAVGGIEDLLLDENFIWATNNGGLLRWARNTGEMTHYTTQNSSIPTNDLSQISSHEGKLYISSDIGIIIYDKADGWELISEDEIGIDLKYHTPLTVYKDTLWVARDNEIARVNLASDGSWEKSPVNIEELKDKGIAKFVESDNNLFAVVTVGDRREGPQKVVEWLNDQWVLQNRPDINYFVDSHGIWWNADFSLLSSSDDQGATWQERYGSWETGLLSLELIDENDNLWIARNSTVLVYKDGEVVSTYDYTGPELNFINILEFDESGRLWIATDGRGLTMFDGSGWHNWQPENSDMREDAIRGMKIGNGKVYAGTFSGAASGGLNIYDIEKDTWTSYWPEESELSGGGVGGIAIDKNGRVFLPTSTRTLDILDGDSWEHLPIPISEEWLLTTKDGLFDKEGNYWMLTDTGTLGIWKYDGADWFYYAIPGSLSSMKMDALGRLWIVGQIGVIVRDEDDVWRLFSPNDLPIGDGWVEDVALDNQNRAWFISKGNIVVFNGTDFQAIPPTIIGESSWGRSLTFDKSGKLWAATSDGLATFSGAVDLAPGGRITLKATDSVTEKEIRQLIK